MYLLNHLLLGFFMSCAALILPGLVNMAAVSMSMKRSLGAGLWFALGASLVMLVQAYLAMAFAGFLSRHPRIFVFLEWAAVILFFVLGAVFWHLAHRSRMKKAPTRRGHPLVIGGLMAFMNALNVPFYFTASTFLKVEGLIQLSNPYRWWLLIGAFAGALLMLGGYVFFARVVVNKSRYVAKYIYLILSGFFFLLAFFQLANLYYDG